MPEPGARRAVLDHRESWAPRVTRAQRAPLELEAALASLGLVHLVLVVCLGRRDSRVRVVIPALQETQGRLEAPVQRAAQDQPGPLESSDLRELAEVLEQLVRLGIPDYLEPRDSWDYPEQPVRRDRPAIWVVLDYRGRVDLRDCWGRWE